MPAGSSPSVDAEEVDDEDEGLAAFDDSTGAGSAVAEVGRDRDATATADLHPGDPLVPALDDLTGTQTEVEGLAAIPGRVELATVGPRDTDVVHHHVGTGDCFGAVADGE